MDSNAMAFFKFGDLTAISNLSQFTSFESVINFICSKWINLKRDSISLSYALPSNPHCLLINENDFVCMLMLVNRIKLAHIDIHVNDKSIMIGTEVGGDSSKSKSVGLDAWESLDVEVSSGSSINIPPINFFRHKEKTLKSAEWANAIQTVGQVFEGGCSEFRNVLCLFATANSFDFEYLKNDKTRVTAQCAYKVDKGCLWRIHGSVEKANGFFYIKTYNPEHTCFDVVNNLVGQAQRMSSDVLATVLIDDVRNKPSIRPKDVVNDLRKDYGLEMPYKSVWRGVEKAKNAIFGDAGSSYDKMRDYFDKLKELDPDFKGEIDYDQESSRFDRCFVAFGACIQGFKYCRPMIFLDGTFLYGKYKGTLLVATAKDGDNGLFHVAFAIVGSENKENWSWFLKNLEPLINERKMTFISDRHPGIINAVNQFVPPAAHSFCMFHIKNNLKDKLRGSCGEFIKSLIHKLFKCSLAPTHELFQFHLSEMKREGGNKVVEFMDALPPTNFASAYFPGNRYGELCSNAAESFNSLIKDYKGLPVVELVNQIRLMVMKKMASRRQESLTWKTLLCPKKDKKFKQRLEFGKSWSISSSNDHVFEIHCEPSMSVDIQQFRCTCGKWQNQGFPCVHAIAVLSRTKEGVLGFVEPYFLTSHYRLSYSFSIPPVPTFGKPVGDEEVIILPPAVKRPPGRPKKTRFLSRVEMTGKRKITCSRCGELGYHNKRTCTEPLPILEPVVEE